VPKAACSPSTPRYPPGRIDHRRHVLIIGVCVCVDPARAFPILVLHAGIAIPFDGLVVAPPAGTGGQDSYGAGQGSYQVTSDPTGRCVPGRDNQADKSVERQPASHTQGQTRHPPKDQGSEYEHPPTSISTGNRVLELTFHRF
jgi:hypothetical protein